MNVLLLSRYTRSGNSSRVRCYQYVPFLEQEGIRVTEAPLSPDNFVADLYAGRPRNWAAIAGSYLRRVGILLASRQFDLLWIERELFPYLPSLPERILTKAGLRYVVDYDDAIFHNYDRNPYGIVRLLLGQKVDRIMRHATLVIAGNTYLAERARRAGARWVEVLPSVVDADRLRPPQEKRDAMFTIGWIGSPLNAHYLKLVQPALARVSARGQAQVILVGSGELTLPDVPLAVHPWIESEEPREIGRFDVGIMPLAEGPWERGKCGYKLLQYFACAVPAVASPVGVNRVIVEDDVNGFLASDPDGWIRALEILRDNPSTRRAMGDSGRRKVEREYSITVTAPRLTSLLRRAAGSL